MQQKEMVLRHLIQSGSITSLEAIEKYGITRLAAVIFKLKRDGHVIISKNITVKNRWGKEVAVVRYILVREDE